MATVDGIPDPFLRVLPNMGRHISPTEKSGRRLDELGSWLSALLFRRSTTVSGLNPVPGPPNQYTSPLPPHYQPKGVTPIQGEVVGYPFRHERRPARSTTWGWARSFSAI
jgi:hypothetical protein